MIGNQAHGSMEDQGLRLVKDCGSPAPFASLQGFESAHRIRFFAGTGDHSSSAERFVLVGC
jgi:hypothetical protein